MGKGQDKALQTKHISSDLANGKAPNSLLAIRALSRSHLCPASLFQDTMGAGNGPV
jgi:hypothetical protein